ncbi:MAG TPA: elongation factor P [Firmicutes bacterium]|nr:elongation factor P [Bacillota bacterium]
MSITPTDFRTGSIFERDGVLWQVVEFQHVKPGKGPAFVRCKLKNLRSGALVDEKIRPDVKLEEVRVESRKMDYLYQQDEFLVVMDKETFDQHMVPKDMLGKQLSLLTEGEELTVSMNGPEAISAELPLTVVREVTFCEPGIKGDTATGATKAATVEGGATVNVPLFINQGDKLKIDTRSFSYLERVRE